MYQFGISGKIIRLLKNIYDKATLRININNETSQEIQISKGVLQGECTSPLLFALYISDLENYMKQKHLEGYFVNNTTDILTLQYADDLVILANSPHDAQRKLNALSDYCNLHQLCIHEDKTKIVHFHKGRTPKRYIKHSCQDKEIQFSNKYTYLGTTFMASGTFNENSKEKLCKARQITGTIKNTMLKTRTHCWQTYMELYKSVLIPTLSYGAEVWGLFQRELIEKGVTQYFKSIFGWQKTTPGYIIRRELGAKSMAVVIVEKTLRFWHKILLMSDKRYIKLCYNSLLSVSKKSSNDITRDKQRNHNWIVNLQVLVSEVNFPEVWDKQSCILLEKEIENIIRAYNELCYANDTKRIINSSYNTSYNSYLISQNYFSLNIPFSNLKLFSQLRTTNSKTFFIYQDDFRHIFSEEETCDICNLYEENSLHHFLFKCPMYDPIRKKFLGNYISPVIEKNTIQSLLAEPTTGKMFDITNYFRNSLKLRAFALNA